jgi:hypothetical protein
MTCKIRGKIVEDCADAPWLSDQTSRLCSVRKIERRCAIFSHQYLHPRTYLLRVLPRVFDDVACVVFSFRALLRVTCRPVAVFPFCLAFLVLTRRM